jgi:arylsulfatase A-like enzyme
MRNWLTLCVILATVAVLQTAALTAETSPPNVIIFIADDVGWNDYGCYGNPAARTPHIDRLAAGGIRFDAAYLTASSCSPSRSSIITGRYPHNNGKAAELHQPISVHLPWFPELLREAGYYTALSGKNHMSTTKPAAGQKPRPKAFDSIDNGRAQGNSGGHANWVKITQERPKDQPFFFWFASYDAHRAWDGDRQWNEERYGPMHRPEDVVVPPFLSDDPDTRQDLASYYNEVTRFDHYIGEVTETLEKQGALDNTLIFVLADNGRPFPRAKTRLHDSGMKTALVAHWPQGIKSTGTTCKSIVSVIDLAPTILQTAGVKAAATMQGVSLAPIFEDVSGQPRKLAFSEHNWHDYEALGRSVRMDNFLFLRNFRPQQPWQGPADSVRSPSHIRLQKLRDSKKLSDAQSDVFLAPRPEVELYRVDQDPHQLTNLAGKAEFANVQRKLDGLLSQWMDATGDSDPGNISRDSFDRETGDRIVKGESYRGTTPGEDRDADRINAPGPH